MVKKFILCACLLIFAGVIFYTVCPKWEYVFVLNEQKEITPINYPVYPANEKVTHYQYSLYRFNKILNKLQLYNPDTRKWFYPKFYGDVVAFMEHEMDKGVWRHNYISKE